MLRSDGVLPGMSTAAVPSLSERASWVEVIPGRITQLEIPRGRSTTYLTHGLYRYVGKLPPPLMAYLLEEYSSPGDVVVDPMSGGGTTAIEAVSAQRSFIGFDINPVARLVTAAVSSLPVDGDFGAFCEEALRAARETPPIAVPAGLESYFSRDAYQVLAGGLRIAKSPAEKLLVLSIARQASYANTKKINTVVDKTKTPRPIDGLLRTAAAKFSRSFEAMAAVGVEDATISEAKSDQMPLEDESADFVLLHPPYLTNTAFSEVTQLQLQLLGHDPVKLRSRELAYRGSYFHVPNGLRKYLVGWSETIKEAKRVVRPGGVIATINGDGSIDGVRIPVGAITKEFATDLGLSIELEAMHILNNHTGLTLSRRMTGQHVQVYRK